jgi:serine/threonine protein phosphatase PrpC
MTIFIVGECSDKQKRYIDRFQRKWLPYFRNLTKSEDLDLEHIDSIGKISKQNSDNVYLYCNKHIIQSHHQIFDKLETAHPVLYLNRRARHTLEKYYNAVNYFSKRYPDTDIHKILSISSQRLNIPIHIIAAMVLNIAKKSGLNLNINSKPKKVFVDKEPQVDFKCIHAEKGHRPTMEDVPVFHHFSNTIFFGVFDGHDGRNAANFFAKAVPAEIREILSKNSESSYVEKISESLIDLDTEYCQTGDYSGTTFSGVILTSSYIYLINIGDSRTLIIDPETNEIHASTKDHKTSVPEERKRIYEAGGFVKNKRVNGQLALTRALGDKEFKFSKEGEFLERDAAVSALPDIQKIPRKEDLIAISATDGFWDVFTNEEAKKEVTSSLHHGVYQVKLDKNLCKKLVEKSISRGSRDNVTIIISRF